ncbi:MAG TPA: hypothetical protein VJZ77_08965 [Blastocatellia bacterium]|nr:hypothetical protein [Blastocatellia bacterium]
MKVMALNALWLLSLSLSIGCQGDVSQLKGRAEELTQSMISGNFDRLIDLTYPKTVELAGGKEKMKQMLEKGMREMKTDGYDFISAPIGTIRDVVKIGSERFVIVEYVLKMKAPGGYLTRDSFLLGVASIDKENWTFIDGTGLQKPEAKTVFPELFGKIEFPQLKPPVFHQSIK